METAHRVKTYPERVVIEKSGQVVLTEWVTLIINSFRARSLSTTVLYHILGVRGYSWPRKTFTLRWIAGMI